MSLNRRTLLKLAAAPIAAPLLRGLPIPKIRDISVITTQPVGVRLVVVKIQTDQDGLYGYGCATFTQRADLVVEAVDRYLKPLLIGRPTNAIEDLWEAMYNSSYWRNGPVLNNAISGVDQALWDIKGRQAGLPVYELLGGKVRKGAMIYSHAAGAEPSETMDQARKIMSRGIKAVRLQVGVPGMAAYGSPAKSKEEPPRSLRRRTMSLSRCRTFAALWSCLRRRENPLDRKSNFCTTCMSGSHHDWPFSSRKTWSNSGSSSWKTCCHRRIWPTSTRSEQTARPRSRWANCSTIHTSGWT